MFNKKLKSQSGFTIIEVLIVLAIAGLMMLVVFLAVPALQRNSRNSQRKSDVSALLGGVAEYSSNNNGRLPTTAAQVISNAKTGYYLDAGNGAGQIALLTGAQAAPAATAANDRVIIVTGARCGQNGATVAGSARQVAVQFQLETSGDPQPTCQES